MELPHDWIHSSDWVGLVPSDFSVYVLDTYVGTVACRSMNTVSLGSSGA